MTEFLWSQETIFKVGQKVLKKTISIRGNVGSFFNLVEKLNRSLISSNFYYALTSFTIMYLVWFKTPIFAFQKS